MRPRRFERLIWLVIFIIFVGDIVTAPWSDAADRIAMADLHDVLEGVQMIYADFRTLIVTAAILVGISVIVRELDPARRKAG